MSRPALVDQVIERNDDFIARQLRTLARRAPAEIRRLAGRRRGQHLGDILLLGHHLHLDLDALVLMRLVEIGDHLGPDLAIGSRKPAPMNDLDRVAGLGAAGPDIEDRPNLPQPQQLKVKTVPRTPQWMFRVVE